jgi:hypothetical protein
LEFEEVSLADLFQSTFSDEEYKPSRENLKITIPNRRINYSQTYTAPAHFFLEQIVGDENVVCSKWVPPLPDLMIRGTQEEVPPEVTIH